MSAKYKLPCEELLNSRNKRKKKQTDKLVQIVEVKKVNQSFRVESIKYTTFTLRDNGGNSSAGTGEVAADGNASRL